MPIQFISPKKAVNSAYLKLPISIEKMDTFKTCLKRMADQGKPGETEEYHKGLINKFLSDALYNPDYAVNTKDRIDLAIFNGKDTNAKAAVLIEVKSPENTAEMFSDTHCNVKALQELVYYFMQEYIRFENHEIKYLVITNYNDWYFFNAKDFVKFFAVKSNPVYDQFKKFDAGQMSSSKTDFFYGNIARPSLEKFLETENIQAVHFNLKKVIAAVEQDKTRELAALYKFLSPETLLAKPFANDSNSLDRNFYAELLHIIGLEEVKEDGKKVIRRKEPKNRDKASLLESAIYQLEIDETDASKCEEIALRLCITWVNRLLFLKLVESQILMYQKGDSSYKFMSLDKIKSFDELNIFFFKVLGKKIDDRDKDIQKKYPNVPYLNSSLFEPTDDETKLKIRGIPDDDIEIFNKTVLKDEKGKRAKGTLQNLDYIFKFLDAYNFASDAQGGVSSTNKTLINASVLGLIFEKINGYKDGSFYTPGFITDYMAKDVLERAVVQKFNEVKSWNCQNIEDVEDKIDDIAEANAIVDDIRIADVAVGSGHFLVSTLNRLLSIKSQLNIFCDVNGKRIKRSDYMLKVDNDELSVIDDEGEPFEYKPGNAERQRIQEALFKEKKRIIENCLFGVDLNPNSVNICRLRLWIELLKNAYYTEDSGFTRLETLPNIDINIKVGDSLLSKYPVQNGRAVLDFLQDADKTDKKNGLAAKLRNYRENVQNYKKGGKDFDKRQIRLNINGLKAQLKEPPSIDLFGNVVKTNDIDFSNSMEWMFEFPEILDDEGKFVGFDVVIGNPPYIQLQTNEGILSSLYETRNYSTFFKQGDLYCLFIERAYMLLKEHGEFAFINPNTWLQSISFSPLRRFLTSNFKWNKIVLTHKVFADATVDTHCLLFTKSKMQNDCEICKIEENSDVQTLHTINKNLITHRDSAINIEITQESLLLIEKIKTQSKPLSELVDVYNGVKPFEKGKGKPAQTKQIVDDKPFVKEGDKPGDNWMPLMRGSLMNRYTNLWNNDYWILYGEWLAAPRNPKIFECSEKIIVRQTGDSIISTLLTGGIICRDNLHVCLSRENENTNLKFILGILNSKLTNFYYTFLNPEKGEALAQVKKAHVEALRIPNASEELQKKISNLVEQTLEAKKQDANADISVFTVEIDKLVYEFYNLTEEEIGVVESV